MGQSVEEKVETLIKNNKVMDAGRERGTGVDVLPK
jgi:hypothetical protein